MKQVFKALGDVRIDSMHVYGIQITGIRGPFSIENDMLYLGGYAHATKRSGRQTNGKSKPLHSRNSV